MNNEPVAWINDEMQVMFMKDLADAYPEIWKPLYTHPAKTLTDEQIFKLAEMLEIKMNHALYAFARTLIREAQKK